MIRNVPKKPKVTLSDVAKESGYSTYTVSSVINDKGDIGAEATERVLAAAKRLGYGYYGTHARQLAVHSIGMVLPDPDCLHDGFYSRGLSTFRKAASNAGYDCKLYTEADFLVKKLREPIAGNHPPALDMEALGCKGLIFYCPWLDYEYTVANCLSKGVAVALIRRNMATMPGLFLALDHDENGMQALLDYHVGQHRNHRLAFVYTGDIQRTFVDRRYLAFTEYCQTHPAVSASIKLPEIAKKIDIKALVDFIRQGTKQGQTCSVSCATDAIANRVMTLLFQHGFRIPEDVRVTGYNNDPIASELSPSLTTMEIPVERMVKAACDYIIQSSNGLPPTKSRRFSHKLIQRDSA
ncbi:LacI family DNA-binding transcriptional regulator [Cerasicoccus fimbriatus]|uniref:LacI family DNA-binding transcriptional regulator n=1 Tax=Cerasicoccus fimbriatus TaxID=3014554 RepID=UPI0022B4784A|nr:LacI family DNA-binding transcriptional regulator [Cerasicoccus sp. TK19100]